MHFDTLDAWLAWQETLHPSAIDLGLERVRAVAERLGVMRPAPVVITIGGTNGKGSCVALLEAILRAAGYRTGAYTSPHLRRYNERIRIDGTEAADESLCAAFERIDAARGDTSLTYFEFGTLAALDLFHRAGIDVALLEVGLGGRLDAVNIVEPDVALVTTVDLDHAQWLGPDRESIGAEKAGIFRGGRPALYGDLDPPASLREHAARVGAELRCYGVDFGDEPEAGGNWRWWGFGAERHALPLPALRGAVQRRNAATVLAALAQLTERLPVDQAAVREGLRGVQLPGRLQVVAGPVPIVLDVAHNPQAAAGLAADLAVMGGGAVHAVVGMLSDKAIPEVLSALAPSVRRWYPATLPGPRGSGAKALAEVLVGLGAEVAGRFDDVPAALAAARAAARPGERIVLFGSFLTVAEALDVLDSTPIAAEVNESQGLPKI